MSCHEPPPPELLEGIGIGEAVRRVANQQQAALNGIEGGGAAPERELYSRLPDQLRAF